MESNGLQNVVLDQDSPDYFLEPISFCFYRFWMEPASSWLRMVGYFKSEFMIVLFRLFPPLTFAVITLSQTEFNQELPSTTTTAPFLSQSIDISSTLLASLFVSLSVTIVTGLFYSSFHGLTGNPVLNVLQLLFDLFHEKSRKLNQIIRMCLLLGVDFSAAIVASYLVQYILSSSFLYSKNIAGYDVLLVQILSSLGSNNYMFTGVMQFLFFFLFCLSFELCFRSYNHIQTMIWKSSSDVGRAEYDVQLAKLEKALKMRAWVGLQKVLLTQFLGSLLLYPLTGSNMDPLFTFTVYYLAYSQSISTFNLGTVSYYVFLSQAVASLAAYGVARMYMMINGTKLHSSLLRLSSQSQSQSGTLQEKTPLITNVNLRVNTNKLAG